jgi:hypothetical protein
VNWVGLCPNLELNLVVPGSAIELDGEAARTIPTAVRF